MLDKTNPEKVRDVAIGLLWTDVKETGHPLFASHPFTDSWYTCITSKNLINLHSPNDLTVWRAAEEKTIKKLPPLVIFRLICSPYRMTFLKYAFPFMSAADIGTALRETWQSVENISGDINVSQREMVNLYHIADRNTLMTSKELKEYNKLPPVITVYRGVTNFNKSKKKAMSWTTDIGTAEWFAKRYNSIGEVWTMDINKKDILAIFDSGEHEVVITPKAIKNIKIDTIA